MRYGHKYSWLVRLVQSGTSWVAPEDIERIGTQTSDTKLAAQQVKGLDKRNKHPKVVTADSRYVIGTFWAHLPVWRTPIRWFGCKTTRNSASNLYQNLRAAGERLASTVQIFNLPRLNVNRMPVKNFSLASRRFVCGSGINCISSG